MRLTTEQLLEKMENIVKATVKLYKSDFYDYDIDYIKNFNPEKYDSFYWIVRECGTHFIHENIATGETGNELILAIRETWENRKEYHAILTNGTWTFTKVQ